MHTTDSIIDLAPPDRYVIVAGMGRSGTTWLAQIINHEGDHRLLHEPFIASRVPEAQPFQHCHYLPPAHEDEALEKAARAILAGTRRNGWVDQFTPRRTYQSRLIKDIRCNLMLGWLHRLSGQPVVLIVRHPLQVAHSWLRLGWGKALDGDRHDLDLLMSQDPLLADFPLIREIAGQFDTSRVLQRTIFLWCVYHHVPRHQLTPAQAHVVFYESLVTQGAREATAIFDYLQRPLNPSQLDHALQRISPTNFLGRDFSGGRKPVLNEWKSYFSQFQIDDAQELLAAFGLNELYDAEGEPTGKNFLENMVKS